MTAIFISHNSADAKEAAALKRWLADNGWADVFLDIDAKDGLSPGERWKDALRTAADRCEAVLCLVSPTWLASAECKLEFRYAEQLRKHLFLAILKPCDPKDLPPDWQWCPLYGDGAQKAIRFEFREQPAECAFLSSGLERLKNGLEKAGISAEHFPWPPANDRDRAPYRGLKPLEAADAAVFFGRNAQTLHGMETLWDMRRTGIERLLVILGASGSGKSSFMRAGLLPRLDRDERQFFPLPVIRPRNAVLFGAEGLAPALAATFAGLGRNLTLGAIEKELNAGPEAFEALLAQLEQWLLGQRPLEPIAGQAEPLPPSLVFPIDQAEELFNPDGAAEAAPFLSLLGQLLTDRDPPGMSAGAHRRALVVLTIRSDRYERLQTASGLSEIKPRLFDLRPFPPAQFERVINGPAERATQAGRRLKIDPRLTERLLADFSEGADTLPLLGFALEKLYHKYASDGDLTLDEYEGIRGGHETVQAAIFQEAIDSALSEPYRPPPIPAERTEQYQGLRRAFIPFLARINPESNEPMRQVAKLAKLPAEVHPLVDRLVEARLLIRDKDAIEVAHESLLRQWPSLRDWLTADRDNLRLWENIRQSAAEWQKENRHEDFLIRGGRLEDAEKLLATPGYVVSADSDERAYLNACTAAQQAREAEKKKQQETEIARLKEIADEKSRAAEAQRQKTRNTKIGLGVAVALLVTAVLAGWQARREAQRADHQARVATAQKIAAQARVHFAAKPDPAVLLSTEASRLDDSVEVKASLLDSLEHDARLQTFLRGHTAPIQCVAFSRDGKFMATGGNDHTIHLWNAQTWQLLGTFPEGHKESVFSLAFSPDSTLLASGSTDQTVRLWNVATREPVGQPLIGHTGWVRSVVFHPDGKMLFSSSATESGENETLRWNLSSQPPSKNAVGGREHMAGNLAVSPDGRLLAIGHGQQSISLWDLQTQSLRGNQLQTEGVFIQSLAFSSDGKALAASDDKGIGLWDLSGTAPKPQELADNVDFTLAVAISPDGKLLAGGGNDTIVHLWDLTTNKQLPRPLVGHRGYVTSLAFHPDGTTLVSGSEDGTLIKWSLIPRSPVRHLLRNPNGVRSAAFSPDEHWLVTDGVDATILVWDLTSGALTPARSVPTGLPVKELAFAADGNAVVACHDDGQVRLWEVHAEQPRETLLPEVHCGLLANDSSKVVAFDQPMSAGGGSEGSRTITVWEIPSGRAALRSARLTVIDEFAVESFALSKDGKHFVVGMGNGTVLLWDLRTTPPARRELLATMDPS